jgi:hypothetical protein
VGDTVGSNIEVEGRRRPPFLDVRRTLTILASVHFFAGWLIPDNPFFSPFSDVRRTSCFIRLPTHLSRLSFVFLSPFSGVRRTSRFTSLSFPFLFLQIPFFLPFSDVRRTSRFMRLILGGKVGDTVGSNVEVEGRRRPSFLDVRRTLTILASVHFFAGWLIPDNPFFFPFF